MSDVEREFFEKAKASQSDDKNDVWNYIKPKTRLRDIGIALVLFVVCMFAIIQFNKSTPPSQTPSMAPSTPKQLTDEERAVLRTKPPRIGMTMEQAKMSSWGAPHVVNKTTTASGTTEQWVYTQKNFLYFEDGILTGIQN